MLHKKLYKIIPKKLYKMLSQKLYKNAPVMTPNRGRNSNLYKKAKPIQICDFSLYLPFIQIVLYRFLYMYLYRIITSRSCTKNLYKKHPKKLYKMVPKSYTKWYQKSYTKWCPKTCTKMLLRSGLVRAIRISCKQALELLDVCRKKNASLR